MMATVFGIMQKLIYKPSKPLPVVGRGLLGVVITGGGLGGWVSRGLLAYGKFTFVEGFHHFGGVPNGLFDVVSPVAVLNWLWHLINDI